MKILSKLSAQVNAGTWSASGTMVAIADEVKVNGKRTGFFRQVELSPGGLVVHNGGDGVMVPLSEILALAEAHEPLLKGPTEADMAAVAATVKAAQARPGVIAKR